MTAGGLVQLGLYVAVLLALVKPLGWYMARVYEGRPCGLDRVLGPVERLLYRLAGVRADDEMRWTTYAWALLLFNGLGLAAVFALQMLQSALPLNPQQFGGVKPDLAFNTAASFVTNTNWQSYSGETTLSYFTQMLGLTVQNFVSAASGMAVLVALIRGIVRRSTGQQEIGNFWVDLTRTVLYILLPLSLVLAVVLVSQGVVQTFGPYQQIELLQPMHVAADNWSSSNVQPHGTHNAGETPAPRWTQTLAVGPAASQVAIKQLGTNGGGFFNANSCHPFENPTPLSNFLEMLAILLIPAALCYTFGRLVGDTRQGWALLAAMGLVFLPMLALCVASESRSNSALRSFGGAVAAVGVDQAAGNMEGKEVRIGAVNGALWATVTTATSNGSVNSMHDSLTPLGGLVGLWMMQLGEVIFGGVGSGLYGMLMFAVIAVFVAGLMVGRTPEYLGKKIEAFEMKMASLVILIPPLLVLSGTAAATMTETGRSAVGNPGPHGFTEMLYAFSSAANNNGSALAGLSVDRPFYNIALGLAMLTGRYALAAAVLAVAGSLASKKTVPPSPGTLPTHRPLFVILLAVMVVIVGALAFLPALGLGPIVEHLMFNR